MATGKVLQSCDGEFCIIPENIFEEFKVKSEMTAPLQARFESDVEGQCVADNYFVPYEESTPESAGYFKYDQPWVASDGNNRLKFDKFRF